MIINGQTLVTVKTAAGETRKNRTQTRKQTLRFCASSGFDHILRWRRRERRIAFFFSMRRNSLLEICQRLRRTVLKMPALVTRLRKRRSNCSWLSPGFNLTEAIADSPPLVCQFRDFPALAGPQEYNSLFLRYRLSLRQFFYLGLLIQRGLLRVSLGGGGRSGDEL